MSGLSKWLAPSILFEINPDSMEKSILPSVFTTWILQIYTKYQKLKIFSTIYKLKFMHWKLILSSLLGSLFRYGLHEDNHADCVCNSCILIGVIQLYHSLALLTYFLFVISLPRSSELHDFNHKRRSRDMAWIIWLMKYVIDYLLFARVWTLFNKENLRVYCCTGGSKSPLKLPMIKNFNLYHEIWTNRTMIRNSYVCSFVTELLYAFP